MSQRTTFVHRRAILSTVSIAFVCHQAAAQAPTSPVSAERLEGVEVVGRSTSGTYQSDEASGAKTALPLRELPQSVRVITRQAIDDLGATRLNDVLDYVGGVSRQNNFGGLWDNIAIRGLPGNENTGMALLLNGFSANRGYNAPRDLAGVERIEFLKGTAAALYGSTEPGGTLNVVTKKPFFRAANSLELYGGNYGQKRIALDSTGPFGESVAYRLNVVADDRGSFRDHIDTKRYVVVPALTIRVDGDTTIDYYGEFLRQATPLDRGVVAVDNRLGAVARNTFLGEPRDGDITVDNLTDQLVVKHAFSADWRTRIALSYRTTHLSGFSTEPTALQADNATLTRNRRYRNYSSDDAALQTEAIGDLRPFGVEQEALIGFEAYHFTIDSLLLRANPTAARPNAINVYNPVYGQPLPALGPNTNTDEGQRNLAVYAQDAIRIATDWRLVPGVRFDDYHQSLLNRLNNVIARQTPSSTAPRIGLSWLPSAQWTVYANAGRSFRPNVGTDFASRPFSPEVGKAYEFGAKWESPDRQIGATAAVFDIRKRNVVTADPVNTGFSISAGEVRSKGVEFDLSGQVTSHWRVNASSTLNQVKITRDNTLEVGGRLLDVPRFNGSLLAVYELDPANGQRLGLGGGVTHTGKRLGQARLQSEALVDAPVFDLPKYTVAKLVAYWKVNPTVRFSLDVDNLFDKTYYTSSFNRLFVAPGTARQITGGLQAKF